MEEGLEGHGAHIPQHSSGASSECGGGLHKDKVSHGVGRARSRFALEVDTQEAEMQQHIQVSAVRGALEAAERDERMAESSVAESFQAEVLEVECEKATGTRSLATSRMQAECEAEVADLVGEHIRLMEEAKIGREEVERWQEELLALQSHRPHNLLDSPLDWTADIWSSRMQRFGLEGGGAVCFKVARNGSLYRRTYWLEHGYLCANGRLFSNRPVSELIGIYKGSASAAFNKLRATTLMSSSPTKWQSILPGGSLHREVCCVVTLTDCSLSMLFDNAVDRDAFAETLACYAQQFPLSRKE